MITGKIYEKVLTGLTSTRSDYDCGDGEMQVCHNMLHDGAGLRPVKAMDAMAGVKAGHELLYVHHTANGDVYITSKDGEMYWTKGGEATQLGVKWLEGGQITNVGNILCMSNGSEIKYFLWKGDAEGYAYLGDKLPELKMEFMLAMEAESESDADALYLCYDKTQKKTDDDESHVYGTTDKNEIEGYGYDDDTILKINDSFDAVFGVVNRMVAAAKEENKFCFPFFVRYAYEMYDGSLMMHSTPILMLPSTTVNPAIECATPVIDVNSQALSVLLSDKIIITSDKRSAPYVLQCPAFNCQLLKGALEARITAAMALEDWKDLITGVKIYVTQQIYPYNADGQVLTLENEYRASENYFIGGWNTNTGIYGGNRLDGTTIEENYVVTKKTDVYETSTLVGSGTVTYENKWLYLPSVEEEALKDKIEQAYNFYLFKEYDLEELSSKEVGTFFEVDALKDTLTNIETREQMTDDYHSHDIITAAVLNTYNSRLNKANCQLIPFTDMPGEWLSCYTSQASEADTSTYTFSADIYLKDNGVKIKVDSTEVVRGLMSGYFYYPNPSAYLMIVKRTDSSGTTQYARLTLEKHPYLFGAYYFSGFEDMVWSDSVAEERVTEGATAFSYPNYIYTSEVENPFVFPSTGVNAVGSGRIVTLKTATKAMSQGTSFGTNPLYAFCTDGIWALEVGDTGIFSAKQPVSRETLLNENALAVTQIDNSILFISERGLMELVGGETRLLSGVLQELHSTFDVEALPHWKDIHKKFGGQPYLEADDFMSYLDGARIAFDYIDYRVVVFRPCDTDTTGSAYMYDMVSKCWGTIENIFLSVVEDNASTLVNYMQDGIVHAGEFTRDGTTLFGEGMGFYTTRPMKFDAPDTLKTVRTLVERGVTKTPHYMALWGSRDMERWVLIGAVEGGRMPRLSGTPYKYFIVGGWAQLPINGGAISRLTADVAEKWTDKLR